MGLEMETFGVDERSGATAAVQRLEGVMHGLSRGLREKAPISCFTVEPNVRAGTAAGFIIGAAEVTSDSRHEVT
jgi:hypothetical protein